MTHLKEAVSHTELCRNEDNLKTKITVFQNEDNSARREGELSGGPSPWPMRPQRSSWRLRAQLERGGTRADTGHCRAERDDARWGMMRRATAHIPASTMRNRRRNVGTRFRRSERPPCTCRVSCTRCTARRFAVSPRSNCHVRQFPVALLGSSRSLAVPLGLLLKPLPH